MNDERFARLRDLIETTGPSGYEWDAQERWRQSVRDIAASVETDRLGNAAAIVNPEGSPRVMLEAHIDEIGFQVKYIDDNGFLYFHTIGGFDGSTLPGNRVRIMGTNGPVYGVIGRKPTHLMTDDDRKAAPKTKDMWIDIGAADRADAEAQVRIGDAGGRAHGVQRLLGSMIAGNSLDDRVGAFVVAEALRRLASEGTSAAVRVVSAVQEEIGLRGATVASYAADVPIGVAVDVTFTSDHPQAPANEVGDIRCGRGPVLTRGANTNPRIFERLVAAAEAEGVPYQIDADPRGTGTDQYAMAVTRAGMATGLVSIPTRYLHTASEVLDLDDLEAAIAILARFVQDLTEDVNLQP